MYAHRHLSLSTLVRYAWSVAPDPVRRGSRAWHDPRNRPAASCGLSACRMRGCRPRVAGPPMRAAWPSGKS